MLKHSKYHFVSRWHIDAPLDEAWAIICNSTGWPEWWRGVVAVEEKKPGGVGDIGVIQQYTWKSVLPYTLTYQAELFERSELQRLSGKATGELEGTGVWEFHQATKGTLITCTWDVHTTKWWMNLMSFALRPIFAYNHKVVMKWGAEGLAKKLDCMLISA